MSALWEHGWLRKWIAGCLVLVLVGGLQWFIYLRTRPPEPAIQFPSGDSLEKLTK